MNRDTDGNEDVEEPSGTPGPECPYGMGKKEMKRWAKCMKKMAHAQHKSAEAYAKSCGQTAAQAAAAGASAASGAAQMDFAAAAAQIQEFLNAFGKFLSINWSLLKLFPTSIQSSNIKYPCF